MMIYHSQTANEYAKFIQLIRAASSTKQKGTCLAYNYSAVKLGYLEQLPSAKFDMSEKLELKSVSSAQEAKGKNKFY